MLPASQLLDQISREITPSDDTLSAWHREYYTNHRSRLAIDVELCRERIPPSSRVLEVGSVPLVLTAALQRDGYNVVGVDIAPDRYRETIHRLGLDVRRCNIETEKLPFGEGEFDAVLMNEVFEHLRVDLVFTFSEVVRVLRPGGLLMLSTPNLLSYRGLSNLLRKGRAAAVCDSVYDEFRKLHTLGHMGHVREYTPAEVGDFLSRCGFRVTGRRFRGDGVTRIERCAIRLSARLRPFCTYFAERIDTGKGQ